METCAELLQAGTLILAKVSESARLDAEVLLAHASGLTRTKLLAELKLVMGDPYCVTFQALIQRRKSGTPIAYLVGKREFFSLPFTVSPAVLIPRPETEQLVELVLQHTAQLQLGTTKRLQILELGTGSGCIALALAHELRQRGVSASLTAVDISADALAIAHENALQLELSNVLFLRSDWFGAVTGEFDLIVSNPPYVPTASPHVSPDTRFEPQVALYAGQDGLDAYRAIFAGIQPHLNSAALFIGEHGLEQGDALRALALAHGFAPDAVQAHRDLTDRIRFLECRAA